MSDREARRQKVAYLAGKRIRRCKWPAGKMGVNNRKSCCEESPSCSGRLSGVL